MIIIIITTCPQMTWRHTKSRKFIFPGILSLLNIVNNIWWRNTKLSSKFVGYLIEFVLFFDFFFLIVTEMKCSSVLWELNALVASYTEVPLHIIKFIKDWSQFLFDSWRNNLSLKHRVTRTAGYARCLQPDWGYFEWTEKHNFYKLIQTFFAMILKNIFIFSKWGK